MALFAYFQLFSHLFAGDGSFHTLYLPVKRIKFYSQNTNLLPPKPKSTFRHLQHGVQEFHRKYVFVRADKAANNVVVV